MTRLAIRLVTLTFFSAGITATLVATGPMIPAFAAGGGGGGGGGGGSNDDIMRPSGASQPPSPPATRSTHRTKRANKQSFLSDPAFTEGYRAAYSTIYDRNDYASAIDQLRALGHDEYPFGRGMQRERELQRVGVRVADS